LKKSGLATSTKFKNISNIDSGKLMLSKSFIEEEIKVASANYKNPALSVMQRVADLLSRMTFK